MTSSALYKKLFLLIGIAVIIGFGVFLSFGGFFLILIFSGFIFFVNYRHEKRVFYVFLLAIILRIIFSFLHMFVGYTLGTGSDLIGDAVGYSGGGAYIAEIMTGNKFEKSFIADELANLIRFRKTYDGLLPEFGWRVDGFTYYLGLIYALFDFSPLSVKFINSFLSVLTVYIIYLYLLKNYGEQIGFIFLTVSLFIPSVFIWSISGLKDPIISFILVAGIFSLVYLMKYGKLWGIILTLGIFLNLLFTSILVALFLLFQKNRGAFLKLIICALVIFLCKNIIYIIRASILPLFSGILLLLFLLYLFLYLYPFKLFRIGIVLSIILLLIAFPVKEIIVNAYKKLTYQSIAKNMVCQYDAVTKYQIYPERYNKDIEMKKKGFIKFSEPSIYEFIIMSLKGIGYALFSPLVWLSRSKFELLSSPEGHFMVISFFGVLSALFSCIRKISYFSLSLPIFIPFIFILALLGFFEGNVGTLFRHREMMLLFYSALFAIGVGNKSIKVVL